MYGENQIGQCVPATDYPPGLGKQMRQVTVAENIDAKIAMHREAIERLEGLKVKLQGSLLDVTIIDLRDAMNF